MFLKQNSDCFQTNSAAEYSPVQLIHRRRIFLTALSRCSDTCPPNTWHTEGGAGERRWGSAAARMLRRQVEMSKSTRSRISPPVAIESLRGSELTGLCLAAGFLFSFFPPLHLCEIQKCLVRSWWRARGRTVTTSPGVWRTTTAGWTPSWNTYAQVSANTPGLHSAPSSKSTILNVVSNLSYLNLQENYYV